MNAPATPATKPARNMLSQAQSFKLCLWLQNAHDSGQITFAATYNGLASAAEDALDFHVNGNNIAGAMKSLEIAIPEAPAPRELALQRRVEALENALRVLCQQVGAPAPALLR